MTDTWDEPTPIEPIRQSGQATSLASLCGQDLANKLGLKALPEAAQAVVREWMLHAIRQSAEHYRQDLERAEERVRKANEETILARRCAVRNE